ncbi:MAG: YiiX/YebB-like N1pC/P60 family cysteine hydrolase [Verrucomicrobiota bacterium]
MAGTCDAGGMNGVWLSRICLVIGLLAGPLAGARNLDQLAAVLRDGDVVFTGGAAGQGAAIIEATNSPVTHCGVVFRENGGWKVLEAVQPVRVTPLADFVKLQGTKTFGIYRLKTPPEGPAMARAWKWGRAQIGKNYDLRFLWGDETMYCSELVWKMYDKAGVRLCEPRTFKDYALEKPAVRKLIKERFGDRTHLPENELVVAPSDLAASPLLEKIRGY